MFHKPFKQQQPNLSSKVAIKRVPDNQSNSITQMAYQVIGRISHYIKGARNTYNIVMNHDGGYDPNAFHHFLKEEYAKLPPNKVKVMILPILSPAITETYQLQIVERVVAIGNPVILNKLREIPRYENVSPDYYEEHPEFPKISGGRAFNSVLEAIGMGVLSTDHSIHTPFTQQMIATLTIKSIEDEGEWYKDNKFKTHFINVVKEETKQLLDRIDAAANQQKAISLDFRFYALKIFLRGFYPNASWNDEWIHTLSQTIEEISDAAFRCITNPYGNVEELRQNAKAKLDPFIDVIMKQDQSFYLNGEYSKNTDQETLRQIAISLLFAGGDNIKKYMDHVLVEFGNDDIRTNYLQKKISKADIHLMVTEVGRRYTTIYAQPGKALEDFTIEYEKGDIKEEFLVKAGDELHYTTWEANIDPLEWGESANKFDPEENQKHYKTLNPLATFGSGSRICRGKSVTLAIIEYFAAEILDAFTWEASVDGEKNYHPTEFNFNNGVKGKIEYNFSQRKLSLEQASGLTRSNKTQSKDAVVPISIFKQSSVIPIVEINVDSIQAKNNQDELNRSRNPYERWR